MPPKTVPAVVGESDRARGGNTKHYWEPEAVVFPLYGTDFTKGVLGATVPLPSGCSGDCGDGVLMGNGQLGTGGGFARVANSAASGICLHS